MSKDDTSELIFQRLGEIQVENRVDHAMIKDNIVEHGERITRVETKITGLVPKVELACSKANGATVGVAELKGEKKGSGKIMRYVWPVVLLGLGAAVPLILRLIISAVKGG